MISESALMSPEHSTAAKERRAWVRVDVPPDSGLRVELHGLDDEGHRIDIFAEPINLSRGGALVRTSCRVRLDAPCLGQFLPEGDEAHAEYAPGRVARLVEVDDGWLIALEFDAPLAITSRIV